MDWTGLLRINHQLIGKGVDLHQHHDSEMGIGENAVACRITLHKHREGISIDQIDILTPVMNKKENNDAPLLDCVEWNCKAVSGQSGMEIDSPFSNSRLNAF